jgi:hypothetical protein
LDWAATQNNLGNALATLGERESGTTRLEEAVHKDLVPALIGRRASADTAQRFSLNSEVAFTSYLPLQLRGLGLVQYL